MGIKADILQKEHFRSETKKVLAIRFKRSEALAID